MTKTTKRMGDRSDVANIWYYAGIDEMSEADLSVDAVTPLAQRQRGPQSGHRGYQHDETGNSSATIASDAEREGA